MAKRSTRKKELLNPAKPQGENYAYKPAKIGPLLKAKAKLKGFDKDYLAAYMGMYWRSVYALFTRTFLTIPEMMQWSEMLGENLFLLYHPNVKPLPDPCEPLRKEIEALRKENTELENKKNLVLEEMIKMKAQNELLREQVKEFAGRK